MDGTLSAGEREERAGLLALFVLLTVAMSLAIPLTYYRGHGKTPLMQAGIATCFLSTLICLGVLLAGRPLPRSAKYLHLALGTVALIVMDLSQRADFSSAWPAFFLILDATFFLRLNTKYFAVVIVMWLILSFLEGAYRFGVYDMNGTSSQERRGEIWERLGGCEKLPCADASGLVQGGLAVVVFLFDFLTMRSFAARVAHEKDAMQNTISTLQHIATALSVYNLDHVRALLNTTTNTLPAEVIRSLRLLEENLREHRRYLPSALLEQLQESESNPPTPHNPTKGNVLLPPGAALGCSDATIVFTDIRASTSIWEVAPEAMRKAIRIHNTILRGLVSFHGGYEVKTIGDAFMIAFSEPEAGVECALRIQETLSRAEWPAALLEVPICRPQISDGVSLWRGLAVRIGVNSGPVTVEENVITRRADYFGHTVNVAARLESSCAPGAISIRAEMWDRVHTHFCESVVISEVSHVALRGVRDRLGVVQIWPATLRGRRDVALEGTHHEVSFPLEGTKASPPPMKCSQATIGAFRICTEDLEDLSSTFSFALESVSPSMVSSGGSVVNLIGSCVFVGWNVSRPCRSHVESALKFVKTLPESLDDIVHGCGLATGYVQHGDVGCPSHRWFTVVGEAVQSAFSLSKLATQRGARCLYSPLVGHDASTTLPETLKTQLTPTDIEKDGHPAIYEVLSCRDASLRSASQSE